ncbi:excinuclease ABC subunit UvrA [Candidatus Gottesmanbacteria bacterium]|nr:excinuclease ABC subunit UvrA [Candidatus Gottesmanbacteria bacterium]
MYDSIKIIGAKQHNLKNVNLTLPKGKLIVFSGLSGSGKSSLAFDTIYAEGQRRYVESLSSYARQFLGVLDKPDVDSIEGLSPSISIDQKTTSHNPRSTVGTVTEMYDYLRLLFARIGHPHCSLCGREIERQTNQQIVSLCIDRMLERSHESPIVRMLILSPVVRDRKGEFSGLFANAKAKGYSDLRVDGVIIGLDEDIGLIKTNKHSIDIVIDRIIVDRALARSMKRGKDERASDNDKMLYKTFRSRVADSIEQALKLSDGLVTVADVQESGFTFPQKPKEMIDLLYSERFACPTCGISLPEIEPRSFSFNSPHGACGDCTGLGKILTVDPDSVMNPILTLSEGGILPFARTFENDTWYSRLVRTVCEEHSISMKQAIGTLTQKQRDILLLGTGERIYSVSGTNRFGEKTRIEEQFKGFISELKARHVSSDSEWVKSEIEKYMREEVCPTCHGDRLKRDALTVTVDGKNIAFVSSLSIGALHAWVSTIGTIIKNDQEKIIATSIIKELKLRSKFLDEVGLEYLSLSRAAMTLSGGEAQRIRLASQIGSGLSGVLYVLDEPSIGLHPRDNAKLISTLKTLRDLGNTVIVVEHDREMIMEADYLVDFGPGAGEHGGAIIAEGTVDEVIKNKYSITGAYLSGKRNLDRFYKHQKLLTDETKYLKIYGASENNLKNLNVSFPLGHFVTITGVSGSGKSTLIVETLYKALQKERGILSREAGAVYKKLEGIEFLDKVVLIDQSPIGRTPRSNPATYTGLFTLIRDVYSEIPEAKLRGYKPGRFSFNVSSRGGKGGRCEACEGEGQRKIEMQFLSDVYVTCEVCHGQRYNIETLEVLYRGKSIAGVLDMTIEDACDFFRHHPLMREKLETLACVGLGYMHLGQSATTLSGGEAQRVKLATELSRRSTGKTMYILDEPTTGLHFGDLEKLLEVLFALRDKGNSLIVIEHNLDVIKNSDWLIDLGPEGGDNGGTLVAVGTPDDIKKNKNSYTGQCLSESTEI